MSARNLLVPHDFTTAGDTALNYAVDLAKTFNAEINLLHVIKNSSDNKKAEAKCSDIIEKLDNKGLTINLIVRKGDIFETIANVAKENHTSIVIMGTHGAKGMQKVFGSFAIKVIKSTHTPFIIVQEGQKYKTTKNIVFPVDISKECLQIEQVVSAIARKSNSKVHILSEKYSDTSYKIKSAVNLQILNKEFSEHNIEHVNENIKKIASNDILSYANTHNCDLIGISYYSDSIFSQFDTIFQEIIMNKDKIPALIINSKEVGNYFF
jgi:nucleotide-binding universal stress UspA family protein